MTYRVIGLMSGSSLDGLDVAYVELQQSSGKWTYAILNTCCYEYDAEWKQLLQNAPRIDALNYMELHTAYGHYLGNMVNRFIREFELEHKVNLISSHGHTTFHIPAKQMTAQLGDGAAIAAETGLHVVSDLRAMDVALGGQGAPVVPIGEKLLFGEYTFLLNLGGIANISMKYEDKYVAFDVCAANRVLNLLVAEKGLEYDDDGKLAEAGNIDLLLLEELNALAYYGKAYPKSLANDFGTDTVFPMIKAKNISTEDALRTYVAHIVVQLKNAVSLLTEKLPAGEPDIPRQLLVTGGGALNGFMVRRLREVFEKMNITVVIPSKDLILYKEALVMALMGVLRWREENNVLSSVTGAKRDSVGGALWL